VLVIFTRFDEEKEQIKSLEGLFFTRPALAIALTISLLSFTGLPLTVGFLGKFFVLFAGINVHQWALACSLIVSSAIGFYAYFKVILSMATRGNLSTFPMPTTFSVSEWFVVALSLVIIYLGIMPSDLTRFISLAVL
jgi:NADH-quinone oxidoreductase subunit N